MLAGAQDKNKEREGKSEKKIGYSGIVSFVHTIRWSLSSFGKKPIKKVISTEKIKEVKQDEFFDEVNSIYTDDNESNQSFASTLCADDKYTNDYLNRESLQLRSSLNCKEYQNNFQDIALNKKISPKLNNEKIKPKLYQRENTDNELLTVPQPKLSELNRKDCNKEPESNSKWDLDSYRSVRSTFSCPSPVPITYRPKESPAMVLSRSLGFSPVPIIKSTKLLISPTRSIPQITRKNGLTKKKVIIREPSIRNLPSCRHRFGEKIQVEKVKLLPSSPPPSPCKSIGNVSSQWCQLYMSARDKVHQIVPQCDPFSTNLIFNENQQEVKQTLENLNSNDIFNIMFNIKKILYADWFNHSMDRINNCQPIPLFDIILFSVQRFVILVSLRVKDFPSQRNLNYFDQLTDLQLKCQKYRFSDPNFCLKETQLIYVDFWCSLLEIF